MKWVVTQSVEDAIDRRNPKPGESDAFQFRGGEENFPNDSWMQILNLKLILKTNSGLGSSNLPFDQAGDKGGLEV